MRDEAQEQAFARLRSSTAQEVGGVKETKVWVRRDDLKVVVQDAEGTMVETEDYAWRFRGEVEWDEYGDSTLVLFKGELIDDEAQ